jgi:hypothetical protein
MRVAQFRVEQLVAFQAPHLKDFRHRDGPIIFAEARSPLHTLAGSIHGNGNAQRPSDIEGLDGVGVDPRGGLAGPGASRGKQPTSEISKT